MAARFDGILFKRVGGHIVKFAGPGMVAFVIKFESLDACETEQSFAGVSSIPAENGVPWRGFFAKELRKETSAVDFGAGGYRGMGGICEGGKEITEIHEVGAYPACGDCAFEIGNQGDMCTCVGGEAFASSDRTAVFHF